jgi:hypothetical protein
MNKEEVLKECERMVNFMMSLAIIGVHNEADQKKLQASQYNVDEFLKYIKENLK